VHFAYLLNTAPAVEPLTIDECKTQCLYDYTDQDSYFQTLVKVARYYAENYLQRRLINSVWDLVLDGFPICESSLQVGYPPLVSVTSITYVDTAGATQTWSSSKYIVDSSSAPARIALAYNESWPTTRKIANAVTIRHTSGYGTAATSIPASILHGMKLFVGHLHANRGDQSVEIPETVKALWDVHRVLTV